MLIPAVFFALISIIVYQFMSNEERLQYVSELLLGKETGKSNSILFNVQKISYIVSRFVFVIQVVYILIKGKILVNRYNNQIANFYSNLENRTILWVNIFLYSFVLTSVLSIVFNIIGRSFFIESPILLLFPSVIFSVLLFFIGLLGYMQNHTVVDLEIEEKESENANTKSYNTNKLNENILELFENDAVYKILDLKITDLSEMLHTNRTYISKHINTEFSCTFNDFVNRYRIEEAKKLLTDDLSKNYSLNYISEKSGFGSMGSFMRVFRDVVGITPGKYRERNAVYNKVNQNLN